MLTDLAAARQVSSSPSLAPDRYLPSAESVQTLGGRVALQIRYAFMSRIIRGDALLFDRRSSGCFTSLSQVVPLSLLKDPCVLH
ncbi:hypothetical protein TNCV_4073671 [Trichonephila clavipes]|uniref:Uncharacterized protein n=1 Tax=Trichonephila clavipes TaxID=2585209 RepID=A0A8X6W8D0_TRICX|nr:hypothetical protein TNCV_4073671 [Trichonephila clavipes]